MTNEQKARELFKSGYNCAQAVFAVYAPHYGIDTQTALKLSSSFGGGMGRLREVCGAVSAMFMIAGLAHGYVSNNDTEEKKVHYTDIQNLAKEFEKLNGSIICRELLNLIAKKDSPQPSQRTAEYYAKRPCEKFVADACNILDEYLAKNKNLQK